MANFKMFWFGDCEGDAKKIEERRKKLLQFSEICGIIVGVIERKIWILLQKRTTILLVGLINKLISMERNKHIRIC